MLYFFCCCSAICWAFCRWSLSHVVVCGLVLFFLVVLQFTPRNSSDVLSSSFFFYVQISKEKKKKNKKKKCPFCCSTCYPLVNFFGVFC